MNVYDFDNTLYNGESAYDFFVFYLKKHPTFIRFLPSVLYNLHLYSKNKLSTKAAEEKLNNIIKKVLSKERYLDKLVEKFWRKNKHKLKRKLLNQVTEKDLIITGSPRFLMEGIKRDLKADIYCTEIDIKNKKISFWCFGENKVKIFKEKYPKGKIENFYSDSYADLPMMKLAKTAYIVKGNEIKKVDL